MTFFLKILELLFEVLTLVILLRSLMSWLTPGQTNLFAKFLYQVTEPILAPLRRILPKFGGFDFSPLVAVVVLQALVQVVVTQRSQTIGAWSGAVFLLRLLMLLFEVLTLIIVLRSLMSWLIPGQTNLFTKFLYQVTEPMLAPLRRVLPKFGGLDFSPFVAVVLLQVLVQVIIIFLP